MKALRTLIADDEALARLRLRQLIGDCPAAPVEVVGEAADAGAVRAWLQAHPEGCDLILLDIRMPGDDGLSLAAELRAMAMAGVPVPLVVFVTAHPDHALEAFEIEAVDYLTKPVRRERLQSALQRAAQRLAPAAASPAPDPTADAALVVQDRGRLLRVPLAQVLYLKAELKYVTLRTAQASHLLDAALSDLEGRYGDTFLRVHRNALVARRAVRALERRWLGAAGADDEAGEGWAVALDGLPDEWLAVSRRQLAAVRDALQRAAG